MAAQVCERKHREGAAKGSGAVLALAAGDYSGSFAGRHPHVMRHTAITSLVPAGVDSSTIQRISGHRTLIMVMRYVHLMGCISTLPLLQSTPDFLA